ncbi:hypothetical protein DFH07DRAFT_49253 [Mycena maculata]|uniref:Uncharacterized protein n=1 Tax=Mycena maculata TaxID=230809 RepID=A0AAD7N2U6_9AGAR|nr:hypothetical protein DFH07DRAFT_49253 [Mycena maculata]
MTGRPRRYPERCPRIFGWQSGGGQRNHPVWRLAVNCSSQGGKGMYLQRIDHLFSPGLFLAERIERRLLPAYNLNVIELGAGCALPSLLMSTVASPPATVVVTDYPDPGILGNVARNVERNAHLVTTGCTVQGFGYEWGTDVAPLLAHERTGYDLVVLSDLLHFHSSHGVLISSVDALLARSPDARIHVAAGNYTKPEVCDNFLSLAAEAGFTFDELLPADGESEWLGRSTVSGLDKMDLAMRKAACRYWVGRRSPLIIHKKGKKNGLHLTTYWKSSRPSAQYLLSGPLRVYL